MGSLIPGPRSAAHAGGSRTEQDRIRNSLSQISDRLSGTEVAYNACETNLVASLRFLEGGHATHLGADAVLRRQINQALFKRIYIERTGGVRADLTEPFSSLLSPTVRDLVATNVGSDQVLDWQAWEDSFNDNTREEDPAGVGLTYDNLVGGTGLEPVTPSLSSWCSPN